MIVFAKLLFIFLVIVISIIALIIAAHGRNLNKFLHLIEEEASQARDESVMLIRAGQACLRSLNDKLYGEESAQIETVNTADLLKSIGPLALLFLNKEKSFLRWGMAGMGLARQGFRFAQGLMKKD